MTEAVAVATEAVVTGAKPDPRFIKKPIALTQGERLQIATFKLVDELAVRTKPLPYADVFDNDPLMKLFDWAMSSKAGKLVELTEGAVSYFQLTEAGKKLVLDLNDLYRENKVALDPFLYAYINGREPHEMFAMANIASVVYDADGNAVAKPDEAFRKYGQENWYDLRMWAAMMKGQNPIVVAYLFQRGAGALNNISVLRDAVGAFTDEHWNGLLSLINDQLIPSDLLAEGFAIEDIDAMFRDFSQHAASVYKYYLDTMQRFNADADAYNNAVAEYEVARLAALEPPAPEIITTRQEILEEVIVEEVADVYTDFWGNEYVVPRYSGPVVPVSRYQSDIALALVLSDMVYSDAYYCGSGWHNPALCWNYGYDRVIVI